LSVSVKHSTPKGYPAESDKVEIGMSYTTRKYRRRPSDLGGKLGLIVAGSAPIWRNGVLLAQEGDRWTVSTGGFLGDDAPGDDAGFLDYLATLPTREIHDIVARSEPLTDYHRYRYAASVRMRYERLARFPDNLLVLGDALCSFNPIYGQGMSVAAQEALLLQQCLRDGPSDIARRFFAAAVKIVDVPWNITVGNDLRHPRVEGSRTPLRRFINWYIGQLHRAATQDDTLARAFLEVANLTAPPPSLLMPANAWRVWRGNLREFLGGRTAVPAATSGP